MTVPSSAAVFTPSTLSVCVCKFFSLILPTQMRSDPVLLVCIYLPSSLSQLIQADVWLLPVKRGLFLSTVASVLFRMADCEEMKSQHKVLTSFKKNNVNFVNVLKHNMNSVGCN